MAPRVGLKRIAILGSTGSVGKQALEVARLHRQSLRVAGLACRRASTTFTEQIAEFQPQIASVAGSDPNLLDRLATDPSIDLVVVALPGVLGLKPTLAALAAGKKVATANKEALVAAGPLIKQVLADVSEAALYPVDSEHSALWQCLRGEDPKSIRRLLITSSGGALRDWPPEVVSTASVAAVLNHPTWPGMGRKITVDSATLMNKALEVIEAHHLFGIPFEDIDVVLHPQSAVHGFVEFTDGSVKAQVGPPDMRIPLQVALLHPDRGVAPWGGLERGKFEWTFSPVDVARYPALLLGYTAGKLGGTAPAVLNAANEEAVSLFLAGAIPFGEIVSLVEATLMAHAPGAADSLDAILAADKWARSRVNAVLR